MVRQGLARLRHRALRAGLALGRRRAPRPEHLGLLLSPERRAGSVALVWALGPGAEPGLPERVGAVLATFDTVVVVTDGLDFAPYVRAGWLFEALPGPALRAAAPGRDWGRYLTRRIDRIRLAWLPDFEAVIGETPDAFVAGARPAAQPNSGR